MSLAHKGSSYRIAVEHHPPHMAPNSIQTTHKSQESIPLHIQIAAEIRLHILELKIW